VDEVKRIRRETRSPRPLAQEAESGLASQDLHPKPLQQERDSGSPLAPALYPLESDAGRKSEDVGSRTRRLLRRTMWTKRTEGKIRLRVVES